MRSTDRKEWAVVTGASSGIGLEFCRRLAEDGTPLLMVSNQDRELREAAAEIAARYGVDTIPLTLDLTLPDAAARIEEAADKAAIDVATLINNAGIFSFNYLTETPQGKIDAFLDLHARAVTHLSTAFARRFAARGGGRILNMSSMSCWMPMPGLAMYASTKAYIRVLSRALHYEMRGSGVSVTVACPGGIATDLFGLPRGLQRFAVRIGVLQTPEKFTRAALKRMRKGRAQYINGLLNRFSILFIGCMPRAARMQVRSRLLDKGIRKP